jgi:hypothetical protein
MKTLKCITSAESATKEYKIYWGDVVINGSCEIDLVLKAKKRGLLFSRMEYETVERKEESGPYITKWYL